MAHRRLYHSTLGRRVIKKKKEPRSLVGGAIAGADGELHRWKLLLQISG